MTKSKGYKVIIAPYQPKKNPCIIPDHKNQQGPLEIACNDPIKFKSSWYKAS